MKIAFNGRFTAAKQTGVQRVATNLIKAVDRQLASNVLHQDRAFTIQIPRGAKPAFSLSNIAVANAGTTTGQIWEQFEFPTHSKGAQLVNLCNTGPLMAESAMTMIHDAQVYLSPDSYSKAFVAWYRFALPRLARRSQFVLTVSDYSKSKLVEFEVAPAESILVIPNGVDHVLASPADTQTVRRFGLTPHRYVFAFGSVQRHKNLDLLLRAFQDPRLDQIKLIVVGRLDWPALSEAFGVAGQDNVLLAGPLLDSEVRGLIENAACMALPSSTEGFGLPPLEAMLLGCPAVVAPAGALPEVCGDAATYAALDSPDEWADAILQLIEDDAGRVARSETAKAHARQFTWERSATLFLAALNQLAS